jgi:hypothetical protein
MVYFDFSGEDVDFVEEIRFGKDAEFGAEVGEEKIGSAHLESDGLLWNDDPDDPVLKIEKIFAL